MLGIRTHSSTATTRAALSLCLALAVIAAQVGPARAEEAEPTPEVEATESPAPEETANPEGEEAPSPAPESERAEPNSLGTPFDEPAATSESETGSEPMATSSDQALGQELAVSRRLWHIRGLLTATPLWVSHPSFDIYSSSDSMALAGFTLEGEWSFFDRLPVSIQVGYNNADLAGTIFSELETALVIREMVIGAQVGYRLWDSVTPYVRGGLLLSWAQTRIEGGDDVMRQEGFAPGAYAMAGVELTLPRRWIRRMFRTDLFTIGLLVEAGYVFAGRFELAADDSSSLVPHNDVALGTLELSGAAMRTGFLLSF